MLDDVKQVPTLHNKRSVEPVELGYKMKFTRNEELIKKYKQLRRELYGIDRRFIGFREFSDTEAENYHDPDDQMLIIHDNDNNVYGGACLRVSTPQYPVILDMENDILPENGNYYFSLKERFPEMELGSYAYSEFNRMVLHPALRTGEETRRIFQAVLDRCIDYRVRYIFSMGDKVRIRLYRQIYYNFGLPETPNNTNIPMRPEYEGYKMYMICWDTKLFHTVAYDPDAASLLQPFNDFEFD